MVPMKVIAIGSAMNFSAALLQVAPGAPAVDWTHQVSQVGLTGALMIAVSILWRSKSHQDETIVQSVQAVTKALEQAAASNVELRRVIEEKLACSCADHRCLPVQSEEHVNGNGRKR